MPGVSRKIICELSLVLMPVTRLRVVCGLGLTMATFSPRIWFSNVDLPTLGRPTIAMVPERNGSGCFSLFWFCVSGIKSMEHYDILDRPFKVEPHGQGRGTFHYPRGAEPRASPPGQGRGDRVKESISGKSLRDR